MLCLSSIGPGWICVFLRHSSDCSIICANFSLVLTPLESDTPPALSMVVKREAGLQGPWCAGVWCQSGCWCLTPGSQWQDWQFWDAGLGVEPGPWWAPWRCGRPPLPGRGWPWRGLCHWPERWGRGICIRDFWRILYSLMEKKQKGNHLECNMLFVIPQHDYDIHYFKQM